MAPESSRILHVSDTALMTAACRALETERPDGWVKDPLAARLAGERGMAIAHALPGLDIMSFGVGMRTRILDAAVSEVVSAHGITVVLSIGAGLDTRPFRIGLPEDLLWVEVDLAPMLAYKSALLAGERAHCRLERRSADLNDAVQRRAVFQAAAQSAAMMITEGLLMYLPRGTVEATAVEARAAGVRLWMLDIATSTMSAAVRMQSFRDVDAVRASDNLTGEEILATVERHGWNTVERRTYGGYGSRLIPPGRLAHMAQRVAHLPPPPPEGDLSGVHLFEAAPL